MENRDGLYEYFVSLVFWKKCNVNNSLVFIFKRLSLKEVNVLNTH